MTHKFEVKPQEQNKRLDLLLTFYVEGFSRTSIRKFLDSGKVIVNGEVEYRPNYKAQEGDVVEIETESDMQRKHLEPYEHQLSVAYMDDDIVIAEKPAGMKVHPSSATENDTFLNALYFTLEKEIGDYGVNLVNRIDQDTSGLVVASISPKGAWHYAKQFAESKVQKQYVCVVDARWSKRYADERVKVANFLNYDWTERKQQVDKQKGDHSLTYFELREENGGDWVLLDAYPETGRTHQIRIHLSHILYPILGDTKYDGQPYERLMLHAHKLQLTSYDGREIEAESSIPPIFTKAIQP